MSKKIYLSPSNQYSNTYATGKTNEMEQCDKIAKATQTALLRCGFGAKLGKSGDSMQNRCVESDAYKADMHLAIHTNAFNGKLTGGTRIFCLNSNGKKACDCVLKYLGNISPGSPDSVRFEENLYEINVPRALSVYVECEFHDTKVGSDWIRNNTTNIAEAICKGICEYYKVSYKSDSGKKPSSPEKFKSYIVRITSTNGVNIRKNAGTDYEIVGAIEQGGAYTIVEEKSGKGATKWGRLKSGIGWIALDYTEKI